MLTLKIQFLLLSIAASSEVAAGCGDPSNQAGICTSSDDAALLQKSVGVDQRIESVLQPQDAGGKEKERVVADQSSSKLLLSLAELDAHVGVEHAMDSFHKYGLTGLSISHLGVVTAVLGGFACIVVLAAAKMLRPDSRAVTVLCLGVLYQVVSISMIETNKWLMDKTRFPYPVTMMTGHMFVSWIGATCLRFCCPAFFPSLVDLEITWWFRAKFMLIGGFFATSIICSNAAYLYCSLPFLQVMKECNIALVYTFAVICGVDVLRRCSVMLLGVILIGTSLTVHGEMHFQMIGFLLQIGGSVCEASKLVTQGILMSGSTKLDPMTLVLFLAPACLVAAFVPFLALESVHLSEIFGRFTVYYPMILINAMLAFALNAVVAVCIERLSPVGYVVMGAMKDMLIVITSSFLLGETLTVTQYVGGFIAISGLFTYSMYKHKKEYFEEDELSTGFSRVLLNTFGTTQKGKQGFKEVEGVKDADSQVSDKVDDIAQDAEAKVLAGKDKLYFPTGAVEACCNPGQCFGSK